MGNSWSVDDTVVAEVFPFFPRLRTNLWCVGFVFSGRWGKAWLRKRGRLMFTAGDLPVSAAEWHLLILWLLLFAYQGSAVLCHRGRTDVETHTKKLKN